MAIGDNWEPVPDVCGERGPDDGEPYPTKWGIPDVLVFDPIGREAWQWNTATDDLIHIQHKYSFKSRPVEFDITDMFNRFNAEWHR